jgi:hypothetical protein
VTRLRWYQWLLAVTLVGIAGMWIYLFFFASRTNQNRIGDHAWATRSEALCASAGRAINALPPARTAKTPQERAATLTQANIIVDQLVSRLAAKPPTGSARDISFVDQWLGDYRSYASSRQAYAKELRNGSNARFAVATQGGAPITLRMDAFSDANGMPSCQVPGDV